MSHIANDIYLEDVVDRFDLALGDERWWDIEEIANDLYSFGYESEADRLFSKLTSEDMRAFKQWKIRAYGDTEVLMDDNS